jgi:OTU domain-containing protein 3
VVIDMAADGNCLFRSISDQLYWDYGDKHEEVRSEVCDYMAAHEDDFSVFLVLDENEQDEDAADFESYIAGMRELGEWGGNLELVAAARLYR